MCHKRGKGCFKFQSSPSRQEILWMINSKSIFTLQTRISSAPCFFPAFWNCNSVRFCRRRTLKRKVPQQFQKAAHPDIFGAKRWRGLVRWEIAVPISIAESSVLVSWNERKYNSALALFIRLSTVSSLLARHDGRQKMCHLFASYSPPSITHAAACV